MRRTTADRVALGATALLTLAPSCSNEPHPTAADGRGGSGGAGTPSATSVSAGGTAGAASSQGAGGSVGAGGAGGSPDDYGGYRPHYQGFGANTVGGRGGALFRVTNLDNQGPGSLREALEASGPRFVVFETSGTIQLTGPIFITNPYVTVAGQTAPSPGITVRGSYLVVDNKEVVLQHLRWRCGAGVGQVDGIYIRGEDHPVSNLVMDHVTVTWCGHEAVGAFAGANVTDPLNDVEPRDLLLVDSIFAEGIAINPNSIGTLFPGFRSNDSTLTLVRNYFAHNGNRNPWISVGWRAAGYNNVAYNPYGVAEDAGTYGFLQLIGCGYDNDAATDVAWTHNVTLAGPDTDASVRPIKVCFSADQVAAGTHFYLSGNSGPNCAADDPWSCVSLCDHCGGAEDANAVTQANSALSSAQAWHAAFDFQMIENEGSAVRDAVLANAGARPLDRDVADARIVADATELDGSCFVINEAEVGGFPELAAIPQAWIDAADPNDIAPGQSFRTNREMKLEAEARTVEVFQGVPR